MVHLGTRVASQNLAMCPRRRILSFAWSDRLITLLARQGHKVLAYKVTGNIFDLGRPQGWLAANIFLGMQSKEFGAAVRELVKELI